MFLTNYIYDTGKGIYTTRQKRVGHVRSGTGDVFSAIIAADAVHDIDFRESVKRASSFVKNVSKLRKPLTFRLLTVYALKKFFIP